MQSRLSQKVVYPPTQAPIKRLSAFFSGFPHSSAAFRTLQRLSALFSGFPHLYFHPWRSSGFPHKNIDGEKIQRNLGKQQMFRVTVRNLDSQVA